MKMGRVKDMPETPEHVKEKMDKILAQFGSKIMKDYYSLEDNCIYIEFLLKNVKGAIITKFELSEVYVVKFEAINKGRLIVSIDLDMER